MKLGRLALSLTPIITAALIFLTSCQLMPTKSRMNEPGNIDLSHWNFQGDGSVRLDGEWEFYWDQLIEPGEFSDSQVELTGHYPVPLYWTKYNDLNLPAKGMATYRLLIETDADNRSFSLKTPEIYTEYSLWINGTLIDSHGYFINQNPRYLRPDVYSFYTEKPTIEIVLQIKNQAHANAGIGQSLFLGTPESVYKLRIAGIALDLLVFAICLFVGCYHLILFFYKRNQYEFLFFAVFCITVAFRGILSNETVIMQISPELPFVIGSRMITALIPVISTSALYFLYYMYPGRIIIKLFQALVTVNIIYLFLTIAAQTFLYSSLFNAYLLSVVGSWVLLLYAVIGSIINGNKHSYIFLVGGVFLIIGSFNDMLYFNQIINTGYNLSLALALFAICQSILLAIRFSTLYNEKEELKGRLLMIEISFLHAQIKPHFIYNTLSAISNMISKNQDIAKELLLDFSDYLRVCFSFDNIEGLNTLGSEIENVRTYLSIEKARFRDRLKVEFDLQEDMTKLIPLLTIQPIVENAVLHGLMNKLEGGTVKISTCNVNGSTHIVVEDDGIGIEGTRINTLLEGSAAKGITLRNIHKRLTHKYGTGLIISSKVNVGTRVEIVIPCITDEEENCEHTGS